MKNGINYETSLCKETRVPVGQWLGGADTVAIAVTGRSFEFVAICIPALCNQCLVHLSNAGLFPHNTVTFV